MHKFLNPLCVLTACTVLALSGLVAAQEARATSAVQPAPGMSDIQVAIPRSAAEVPGPVAGIAMTDAYVQLVGRMAYFWGYPMVNANNRRAAFARAPAPGIVGGVLPVAPVGFNQMLTDYVKPEQTFIVCPNQDVVYGAGFTALDKEPVVVQVPDFGDRFFVYGMYDQRTDEIGRIGKQYGTKPGFYMIVGPNWKGELPKGITAVIRSSTDLVFFVPRIFKDSTPEDTVAIQAVINQVLMYPLGQFDGTMKTRDYSKSPQFPAPEATTNAAQGETRWVKPDTYFDDLAVVMNQVPPLPGEEALYGWIKSVWEAAGKNPQVRKTLVDSFAGADAELVKPLLQFQYAGKSMGNGWNSALNAADWGTDYLTRTSISKSAMYANTQAETQYQMREFDSEGQPLDGNNQYTITFAKGQVPPVKGFWSLTLYNEDKFFVANELNRFSLGTKNKSLKYTSDGSLTLYLGAKSPGKALESNWLPAPADRFSLMLRLYWPEASVKDGKWLAPDVKKVN